MKPNSLFLALQLCSVPMEKNNTSIFILFYKQIFNSLKKIVSTLSTCGLKFAMPKVPGSHLHKHKKWLRKMEVWPKKGGILQVLLQELRIKKMFWILLLSLYTSLCSFKLHLTWKSIFNFMDFQVATLNQLTWTNICLLVHSNNRKYSCYWTIFYMECVWGKICAN